MLNRCSLPVLHSAAALLRLAHMEYAGTTSFFIRVLLDKKYALPFKVGGCVWGAPVGDASDGRMLLNVERPAPPADRDPSPA